MEYPAKFMRIINHEMYKFMRVYLNERVLLSLHAFFAESAIMVCHFSTKT